MKTSITKIHYSLIILFGLSHFSFSQSSDSARYKNPVNVPDTQRTPPHRTVTDHPDSKKLKGGALIDTVTTKKRVKHRNTIDDQMDPLKKPKQ